MPVGEIGDPVEPTRLDIEAIAAKAIAERDSGAADWEVFIRGEVYNACESCNANLEAIRAIVNAAPIPKVDLSRPLDEMLTDDAILELKIIGDIVKIKTAAGWQVGTILKG